MQTLNLIFCGITLTGVISEDGTTTAGDDYTELTVASPGTAMFTGADNDDQADVTLAILPDTDIEDLEQLTLRITTIAATPAGNNHVVGELDKATVNIIDDDIETKYYFDCPEYFFTEGGGAVTVTIFRDGDLTVSAIVSKYTRLLDNPTQLGQ